MWLDLDCVVTGNLDPVLGRSEDFIAWKDIAPPQPYCGSMVMMDAGARRLARLCERVWLFWQ